MIVTIVKFKRINTHFTEIKTHLLHNTVLIFCYELDGLAGVTVTIMNFAISGSRFVELFVKGNMPFSYSHAMWFHHARTVKRPQLKAQ